MQESEIIRMKCGYIPEFFFGFCKKARKLLH